MQGKNEKRELIRGLSLTTAMMIVIGSAIGSGIYRKPASMASLLMSPELLILVWIVAGAITFIGALSNAEIAGIIDETGGQFAYFKNIYGDFPAFLYGWATLAVIQSGSEAAIAYVFAEYLGYFIHYPHLPDHIEKFALYIPLVGNIYPLHEFFTKIVAVMCLLFLTGINYIGVIFGGGIQTVITIIKISSIFLLTLLLFLLGQGSMSNVYTGFSLPSDRNLLSAFGLAISGAFWAYDGWNNVTFVAGEVKNPRRNVPLALLFGTVTVILIYVLINISFLYVLPVEKMASSPLVAASAAEVIFGPAGASIISVAVIISAFGALNGSLLATARIVFAMSRSRLFFSALDKVHPRFRTPHVALVVLGLWACVLVFTGTFDIITNYVVFASWLFYALGAYGVIRLRQINPKAPRPYKVPGYPFTPLVFVVFSAAYLINTVISDTQSAMMGVLLVAIGVPFYYYWKKSGQLTPASRE